MLGNHPDLENSDTDPAAVILEPASSQPPQQQRVTPRERDKPFAICGGTLANTALISADLGGTSAKRTRTILRALGVRAVRVPGWPQRIFWDVTDFRKKLAEQVIDPAKPGARRKRREK